MKGSFRQANGILKSIFVEIEPDPHPDCTEDIMRKIYFSLFFILFHFSVQAQDTCECRDLVQRGGAGRWGQYSKSTTTNPFNGICFDGKHDLNGEWKRYKNGYVVEVRQYVYNGIAHYTYKEVLKDSVISIEESYNQYSNKLEYKIVIYEKNGNRYRMTYTYTTEGQLMELQRERFLKKGEGKAAGAPDHVFNKDGYYYSPEQDGPYLFYGGRYGIQISKTPLTAGQYAGGYKTGYWYEKYDTGTLKSTGWYKRDDKDSSWTNYHFNGKIESKGRYVNNGKDGEWKYWDYEGNLIEVSHFVMPFQEGSSVKYYANGKLKSQEEFKTGKLNGHCQSWFENGQPESDFYYENGVKNGIGKTWFASGQIKTEGNYRMGMPDGMYREWYEDGKLAEQKNYAKNIPNDTNVTWYKNGNVKTVFIFDPVSLKGSNTFWYENGNKEKEEWMLNRKKEGICSYWDTSGVLLQQIQFSGNIPNGIYKTWNKKGQLISEYNYSNQIRNGRCRRWDENGNLIFDREYENGKPKNYKTANKITTVIDCKPAPEHPNSACKSIQDTYEYDAVYIAYQSVMNPASPYYDSVIVPEKLIDESLLNLIQVYNCMSKNYPDIFSIHEYYAGHVQGLYNVTITFSNTALPEWTANWKKGITKTGNEAIDKLIAANGISISLENNAANASYGYFNFTSSQPINASALDRRLKLINPNITCYSNAHSIGDGDHIRFEKKENYTIAEYSHGYGDCPSGCIGRQVFRLYLYADGEADMIENGGTFNGYNRMHED